MSYNPGTKIRMRFDILSGAKQDDMVPVRCS